MKSKLFYFLFLVFFLFLFFNINAQTKVVKIGGIFDLTGATGDVGAPYSLGARDYVEYINSKGGINGNKIEFVWTDYKYNVDIALEFYNNNLKGKVVGIIGWGTGDTLKLAPLVAQDKIPFVSASYDENLADPKKNPYNFVCGPTYSDQIRVILKHFSSKFGKNAKVAIFHHPSAFGESPIPAAKDEANKLGIIISDIIPMTQDVDYVAKIKTLNEAGVKGIIINNVAVPTLNFLKAYSTTGAKMQIYGLNWTVNEDMIQLAGNLLDGFIYASAVAFPHENVEGIKEILSFKDTPVSRRINYIQGWATVKVLVEGIRLAGQNLTGEGIKSALEKLSNFSTGNIFYNITFTPNSHKGSLKLRLYEYKASEGKFIKIADFISAQ
ncbi:MAG: ABC transporter substrate-binding protein [Spirochaetes bacterium]|nr:ABC transporter substrate-binding protein [Spirochaetota bacterium]